MKRQAEALIKAVPPSGGSLEIGNRIVMSTIFSRIPAKFPLRGDP